jgi:diguanylate cyclase (GGDEF)-like protein/PAS domain S-box-containing protein
VSRRRLHVGWGVVALMPALLFFTLGAYALLTSRTQYEQRAELLSQNLTHALEHSLSANIEKIDLVLNAVVDDLEHQLTSGPLDLALANARLQSQAAGRAELAGVRVTDAKGIAILGPGVDTRSPPDFSTREWFMVQRDSPDTGLHVSHPLISKLSSAWIISFSRRYRTPQGEFAGAVSAAVPLSFLNEQLLAVDAGPHGTITLRHADLSLIARQPAVSGTDGVGSRKVTRELADLMASGRPQASYRAIGALDGNERTFAFRRLSIVPLVVIVGLGRDDYLSGWHRELVAVIVLSIAIVLIYGSAGTLLWRTLAQNRLARRRIELLAQVFEHSGEAIMVTDSRDRIIEVNPAFVRQTGYAADEILGCDASVLDSQQTTPEQIEAIRATLRREGLWRGEVWDRARDGREYPKWLSISTVRDEQGDIQFHICSSTDVTEIKQAERQILHLAHHDTLTQLPNRVNLLVRLEQAMAGARREQQALAMLFIDMDRFKNINDTLGHQVGDGLLMAVGQRLRALVRDCDIVARLGGDEFVVVLTGIGPDGERAASAVAGKVLAELGRPYQVRGHHLHSTPSIGIALFPADGGDADTLMRNADTAMYHAKSVGRNNFQFFESAMNEASAERLLLEDGLRTAITSGELSLHYQPQLDLPSGQVVGLEALLRWRHPVLGMVPPLKFIPVAEDTGQIEAIGLWVLEQALAQIAIWRRAGHHEMRVAVNLSAHQLRSGKFTEHVSRALSLHGLPGEALELEITESVAMRDPARTAELLRQLRRHGVALAIDDFGTGYSSLAYLKQLPLSCLKLDRSFVMDIESDPNDAAICTATIQLAHSLGLGVVAEGVETSVQLEFLRRLGCDIVQGYYISKPLPAAEMTRFLQDQVLESTA